MSIWFCMQSYSLLHIRTDISIQQKVLENLSLILETENFEIFKKILFLTANP